MSHDAKRCQAIIILSAEIRQLRELQRNRRVTTLIYLQSHSYSMTFHKWSLPATVYPSLFYSSDLGGLSTLLREGLNGTQVIATFAHEGINRSGFKSTVYALHQRQGSDLCERILWQKMWLFASLIVNKDSSFCQSVMWFSAAAGKSHSSPFLLSFSSTKSCLLGLHWENLTPNTISYLSIRLFLNLTPVTSSLLFYT